MRILLTTNYDAIFAVEMILHTPRMDLNKDY